MPKQNTDKNCVYVWLFDVLWVKFRTKFCVQILWCCQQKQKKNHIQKEKAMKTAATAATFQRVYFVCLRYIEMHVPYTKTHSKEFRIRTAIRNPITTHSVNTQSK